MRVICGMHRSGTSLVAGIAHSLGADMGDSDGFYPADRWNPDGYFEQREILDANIKLVNGAWGRAAYLKLPSDQTIAARARRLDPIMQHLVARFESRVVKENRLCLTLGAWRAAGARVDRLLIVFRNPVDVASSLWDRNRLPGFVAMSLWNEHYRRLFRHAEGLETSVLWYDALVRGGPEAIRQSAKLAWLIDCNPDLAADYALGRVRPGTRAPGPRREQLPPRVRAIYSELVERSMESP